MLGIIGLIIGLVFLVVVIFKGWSILPASLVAGLIVAITNQTHLWETFSDFYSTGFSNYVKTWFIIFMLGALFGELMGVTGNAKSVAYKLIDIMGAKNAPYALALTTFVLCYSGVGSFVVVFAIYPIAVVLFSEAKLPRRLIVASVFFGAATINPALPGNTTMQNLIPANFYGVSLTAVPLMSFVAAGIYLVMGIVYFRREIRIAGIKGEVFVPIPTDNIEDVSIEQGRKGLPDWRLAFLPIVIVVALILSLSRVLPAAPAAVMVGLASGILTILITSFKLVPDPIKTISRGCLNCAAPLLNTAAIVGFGSIVAKTSSFQNVVDFALSLKFSPYVTGAVSVNLVAGITGSASGGLQIFLDAMGHELVSRGANPAAFAKVIGIASGALDTLPHNGAVVSILTLLGSNHKESYRDVFIITVIMPAIVTVAAIIMANLFY